MGILLLAQGFQCDFYLLNRYLTANSEAPVRHVEKHWLGVSHDQISGWLLESRGLPEELLTAARYHHDESYWGDHAVYSQLVLVANCLLESRGLGFGELTDLPAFSLEMLALDEAIARALVDELLAGQREHDNLARLVA